MKQRELDDLARNVGNVKRVIAPFRNHLPDFTAPKSQRCRQLSVVRNGWTSRTSI